MYIYYQWWILGEANEAVASGPSKIAHIVSFRCKCFLEIIMKSERKLRKIKSNRGKDLFFFEITMILGAK